MIAAGWGHSEPELVYRGEVVQSLGADSGDQGQGQLSSNSYLRLNHQPVNLIWPWSGYVQVLGSGSLC